MAQWIDSKYTLLLSNRFDRFTNKNGTINFRCPYCGDSQKDKTKARGYIIEKKQEYYYYCHNCHINRSFSKFLEEQDPGLYKEYVMETLKEKAGSNTNVSNVGTFTKASPAQKWIGMKPFKKLKKISQLPIHHPAVRYIKERQIPSSLHYKIYYVDNGYKWAKEWLPSKFPNDFDGKDPRIILPLKDSKGKYFGAIARSINPDNKQRYLKLNWNDDSSGFLYGLDTVDQSKRVYVLEGQFDSMFIPNAVAVGSMHYKLIRQHLKAEDIVVVLDNEPRSKFTKSAVDSAIDNGYSVCVWPSHIKEKDINDMVVAGMDPIDIKQIIDGNTFSGLKAKLAMSVWSK